MAVVTRDEYFAAALEILADDGPGALTVGALCRRFDVTVGSFYHHFRNVEAFVDALLDHWTTQQTTRIVELSTAPADAGERVERLKSLARTVPHRAEAAIRAWATTNPQVRRVQDHVDAQRTAALADIVGGVVHDDAAAQRLAVLGMSLLIGWQQWRVDHGEAELAALLDEFDSVVQRAGRYHP